LWKGTRSSSRAPTSVARTRAQAWYSPDLPPPFFPALPVLTCEPAHEARRGRSGSRSHCEIGFSSSRGSSFSSRRAVGGGSQAFPSRWTDGCDLTALWWTASSAVPLAGDGDPSMRRGSSSGSWRASAGVRQGRGDVCRLERRVRKLVTIAHDNGFTTRYGTAASSTLALGSEWQGGSKCMCGGNWASHGPHLHFEVRKRGEALDPFKWCNL
ncbi:hypothetical protein CLOP_g6646, partial [Closterium sp. NIES-67]